MKTSEKVRAALEANPCSSAADLAQAVGVTRQRVHQICRAEGLKPKDMRRGFKPGRKSDPNWVRPNHFGGQKQLSSHFTGGASELTASADLLRRGVPVYRALTFVSAADLIIDLDGRLLRVEVRSAKRNASGHIRYAAPQKGRYDVLALVEPDGSVTYRPSLDELAEAGHRT